MVHQSKGFSTLNTNLCISRCKNSICNNVNDVIIGTLKNVVEIQPCTFPTHYTSFERISNVLCFSTDVNIATFHFITSFPQIEKYVFVKLKIVEK